MVDLRVASCELAPDRSDLTPHGKEAPDGRPAPMHSSAAIRKSRKEKRWAFVTGLAAPRGPTAAPPRVPGRHRYGHTVSREGAVAYPHRG